MTERIRFTGSPPTGADPGEVQKRYALAAAFLVAHKRTSTSQIETIAEEGMSLDEGFVWPLWQALAHCERAPERVLRELYGKGKWFINIALANNRACPRDILIAFSKLKKESKGALEDANKELREQAKKQLRPGELSSSQEQ